jgi:hypothetical protein
MLACSTINIIGKTSMKHLFSGNSIKNALKIRIMLYKEVLFTPESLHYACLASRPVQFAAGRTSTHLFC